MNINSILKLKKLLLIAAIAFLVFYTTGCITPEMPIPAEALMHKSKAEILEIAFAKDAPRIRALDNQVNICARDFHGGYTCMRFKTIEDALHKERLMNSNEWLFYNTTSPLSHGTYYWNVNFKDDKVVEAKKVRVSDF